VFAVLSVGCHQSVLFGQAAVRPCRGVIGRAKLIEFGEELIAQLR
jgi:hypothetical protein